MKMNRTVLLLEDDFDLVSIISYILETEGFKVIVSNPKTYRQDILESQPGLILLDHWLKGTLGSTICEELKSNPATHFIPVVLTSATNGIQDIAKKCKADDVLPKPFDIDLLLSQVARLTATPLEVRC